MWGTGRVKTLPPGVHGGILARRDLPEPLEAVGKPSISLIDVVRMSCTWKFCAYSQFEWLAVLSTGIAINTLPASTLSLIVRIRRVRASLSAKLEHKCKSTDS